MQHDHKILKNASIKIDGSGDKEFKKQLTSYLRKCLGENKIKKFRFVDSERDNLIQLADMNVGAIARSFNTERKDASKWLNILEKAGKIKEKDIWEFQ